MDGIKYRKGAQKHIFERTYGNLKAWQKASVYEQASKIADAIEEGELEREDGINYVSMRALARRTMELAEKDNYVDGAINAARIYGGLGKENIATSKLKIVIDKAIKAGKVNRRDYREIERFMERHTKRKHQSDRGIESRVGVFIFSAIAGIALSVFSFQSTGNAVSGVVGSSQGLLGILLFIFGVTGMFFRLNK
jgi:polyhydroxyalkanoate synthesis regulator phasin